MKRDVVAGMLLVNAIPHAVVGFAGQRCLTPLGGEDSGPGLNLLWSVINLVGGAAILSSASWPAGRRDTAAGRRRSLQLGLATMAVFGQIYEMTRRARRR
jgi:hypothetical protein